MRIPLRHPKNRLQSLVNAGFQVALVSGCLLMMVVVLPKDFTRTQALLFACLGVTGLVVFLAAVLIDGRRQIARWVKSLPQRLGEIQDRIENGTL